MSGPVRPGILRVGDFLPGQRQDTGRPPLFGTEPGGSADAVACVGDRPLSSQAASVSSRPSGSRRFPWWTTPSGTPARRQRTGSSVPPRAADAAPSSAGRTRRRWRHGHRPRPGSSPACRPLRSTAGPPPPTRRRTSETTCAGRRAPDPADNTHPTAADPAAAARRTPRQRTPPTHPGAVPPPPAPPRQAAHDQPEPLSVTKPSWATAATAGAVGAPREKETALPTNTALAPARARAPQGGGSAGVHPWTDTCVRPGADTVPAVV